MATDPICGMSVDEATADRTLLRDGRTYYFCSSSCLAEFDDPVRAEERLARRLLVAWPATIAVVGLELLVRGPIAERAELLLALAVLAYPGLTFYEGTFDAIRARRANMDVLVAVAATLAFAYSAGGVLLPGRLPAATYFDASSLIVSLILTGHLLERRTRARASSALLRLPALLPNRVAVLRGGRALEVPASGVEVGDLLTVPPGGRVPADGRVTSGRSTSDESILTGEARPVPKAPGDRVLAGAVNGPGRLEVTAERVGTDTFLAEVGRLLGEAESERVPLRRLADRLAAWFVPFVLALGTATGLLWAVAGAGPGIALLAFVSVVITACPCAFGIATPAALLVATGRAAEDGVLFRGGDALERAARVDLVLMDKTGTITGTVPILSAIRPSAGRTVEELLALSAGLESAIAHPWARAVVTAASSQGVAPVRVEEVELTTGGVRGRASGAEVEIRAAARPGGGADVPPGEASAATTWSEVVRDGVTIGRLGFTESIDPEAAGAIAGLRRRGVAVALVTGDLEGPARSVAEAVGITEVHAGLRPLDKLSVLATQRSEGHRVAFVGDGVNDAPALAAADLGIALASGTEVAQAAGQVLLVRSDLRGVVVALDTGRRAVAKVRQNLLWALGYNAVLLPIAAGALVPFFGLGVFGVLPVAGALAMGLSSTLVVANSLSLRRTIGRPSSGPERSGAAAA